jgi:hypothetical protein
MSIAQQELQSFLMYAQHFIALGSDLNIDELFDQWRVENPTIEFQLESTAAINASIQDYQRGERGTFPEEHSAKLRRQRAVADE